MKKYENPSLEVKKFNIDDVISASKTADDGVIGNESDTSDAEELE